MLWLVIESAVSVSLDVANAEADEEVVVSPADELEDVASSDEYPNDFLNRVNSGLLCFLESTASASRREAATAAMFRYRW